MKKNSLLLVLTLTIGAFATLPVAKADDPAPTCGPDGCQKPGVRVLMPKPADDPAPTCGPDGCQKPGVALQ